MFYRGVARDIVPIHIRHVGLTETLIGSRITDEFHVPDIFAFIENHLKLFR